MEELMLLDWISQPKNLAEVRSSGNGSSCKLLDGMRGNFGSQRISNHRQIKLGRYWRNVTYGVLCEG